MSKEGTMSKPMKILLRFYRSETGAEPVRDW